MLGGLINFVKFGELVVTMLLILKCRLSRKK